MKKNAFSLIELLLVIIIFAVVSLITMPFIANLINNARKDAFLESAYSMIDAANHYHSTSYLNHNDKNLNINFPDTENKLKLNGGYLPTSGTLKMDKEGNIEFQIWNDSANICLEKKINKNEIKEIDKTKDDCHL